MANRASLQQAAKEYEKNVRSYLQQMVRAGSANMAGQPAPWGPSGSSYGDGRGMTFRSGETPSDTQVKQYINARGGNPYVRELMGLSGGKTITRRQVASALTRAGAAEQATLGSFLQEAQDKLNEANEANKQRYEDILERLESRYQRGKDRVSNWGRSAEADAREQAAETMGNVQANLSARGLGNSTIVEAFRQRNSRDLNRNLTQISEMRDSRAAQYDQALSGDIASFMERRTDKAPDFGQIAALAQAYGVGGGGQGFAGQDMGDGTYRQQQYIPAQQAPQIYGGGGVSASTAMQMAAMTTGMMSPMMAAAYGPRIGFVPNQYGYGGGMQEYSQEEGAQGGGSGMTPVQERVAREQQEKEQRIANRQFANNQMQQNKPYFERQQQSGVYGPLPQPGYSYQPNVPNGPQVPPGYSPGGGPHGLTSLPMPQSTPTPSYRQPPSPTAQRYLDYSAGLTGATNTANYARDLVGKMGAGYDALVSQQQQYINRGYKNPPTMMDRAIDSHVLGARNNYNEAAKQFGGAYRNVVDTMPQAPQWQGWDSMIPYWMK